MTLRRRHPAEDVCVSNPPVPGKRALVDNIYTGLRAAIVAFTRDLAFRPKHFEHREPASAKVLNACTLMCGAALTKETGVFVEDRIGRIYLSQGGGEV